MLQKTYVQDYKQKKNHCGFTLIRKTLASKNVSITFQKKNLQNTIKKFTMKPQMKKKKHSKTQLEQDFIIVTTFVFVIKKVLNVIVPHCRAVGYGFLFYCVSKTVMNCLLLYVTLVLTANINLNASSNKQAQELRLFCL